MSPPELVSAARPLPPPPLFADPAKAAAQLPVIRRGGVEPKPLLGRDGAEEGLRGRFAAAVGTTTGPATDAAPEATLAAFTADTPACAVVAAVDAAAGAATAFSADASAGSGGNAVREDIVWLLSARPVVAGNGGGSGGPLLPQGPITPLRSDSSTELQTPIGDAQSVVSDPWTPQYRGGEGDIKRVLGGTKTTGLHLCGMPGRGDGVSRKSPKDEPKEAATRRPGVEAARAGWLGGGDAHTPDTAMCPAFGWPPWLELDGRCGGGVVTNRGCKFSFPLIGGSACDRFADAVASDDCCCVGAKAERPPMPLPPELVLPPTRLLFTPVLSRMPLLWKRSVLPVALLDAQPVGRERWSQASVTPSPSPAAGRAEPIRTASPLSVASGSGASPSMQYGRGGEADGIIASALGAAPGDGEK